MCSLCQERVLLELRKHLSFNDSALRNVITLQYASTEIAPRFNYRVLPQ
jgi:hypothetical protein